MPPVPVLMLECLFVFYVSTFVHEFGHVVAGRLAGLVVRSFGLGTSRPLWVVRVCGIRIYACLIRPFQGLTWAFSPQLYNSKGQTIAWVAGGVLANGATSLLALGLCWLLPAGSVHWLTIAGINGLLCLNIIPFSARVGTETLRSDGRLILDALQSRSMATPAPTTIQTARFFCGLFSAIGDTVMLRVYLLGTAESWVALDDTENADAVLAEARELADPEMPALQALQDLVRGEVNLATGRLDEAAIAFDAAEMFYAANTYQVGQFLVALFRAQIRLRRGEAEGVSAELDALEAQPLTGRFPGLGLATIVLRLHVSVVRSDSLAVTEILEQYESKRHGEPSTARDLSVHALVARFYAGCGDLEAAEHSYRRALNAVAELAAAWTAEADRTRFLDRRSALFTEARDCLEARGKGEEAGELIRRLSEPPGSASGAPNPGLVRLGLRLMGLNVVSIVVLTVAALSLESRHAFLLLMLASLISFFTIAAGLYVVFHLVLGRRLSLPRLGQGRMIVFLTCFPWPIAIGVLVTALRA